jgi:hypothetical protein
MAVMISSGSRPWRKIEVVRGLQTELALTDVQRHALARELKRARIAADAARSGT